MLNRNFLNAIILSLFIAALLVSCSDTPVPKPKGYFRIDLPERNYVVFDTSFPYTFEYPDYAVVELRDDKAAGPFWLDLNFPRFNGQIHLSYKQIDDNLIEYLEDSRTFVMKHIPKARAINDSIIIREDAKVFGLVYNIEGVEAASPYQFFLTDSLNHFIRGALYFNFAPNNDSLEPVILHLEEDIRHLIDSFQWKEL
jgi:gliding motility-associated lipoprotein GldD